MFRLKQITDCGIFDKVEIYIILYILREPVEFETERKVCYTHFGITYRNGEFATE